MKNARMILTCLAGVLISNSAAAVDLGPRPKFATADPARIELGQLLFYDPILSGNRSISCATCHHPRHGTADAVSLAIGEGGIGLGPDRRIDPDNPPEQRIPRNAPALWNLGASEFTVMFHDGRLEADPDEPFGVRTPLGVQMLPGFQSVLAAQAMFPVLSPDEMAGHYSENDISKAVRLGFITQDGGAWDIIAARVVDIPEYQKRFAEVAPGQEISFAEIANVMADFIAFEWRADNSAFDRAMTGEGDLSAEATAGMELFYGKAGCSSCHAGWFQTDHDFHAIALPQIGPGKAARFENHSRDVGRMRVTGQAEDAYAFRTPSLRNVTLTAPYGHNGAFADLEAMVRHHLDPQASLAGYDVRAAVLPEFPGARDLGQLNDPVEKAKISEANGLHPIRLNDDEVTSLIAFLHSLEDGAERLGVPDRVPSGLAVER